MTIIDFSQSTNMNGGEFEFNCSVDELIKLKSLIEGAISNSELLNQTPEIELDVNEKIMIPFSLHPYTDYFTINKKQYKIGFNSYKNNE